MDIPYRFFAKGLISWQQHEKLVESIDSIVWKTYRFFKSRETTLGEKTVLCYFQESLIKQVRKLMDEHHLSLEPQDEKVFKMIDTEEFIQSKLTF